MALILSIETSTPICSAALHEGTELLSYAELRLAKSHSAMLSSLIEQVLQNAQKTFSDLQAIAIAKGPGSYTGLRIGTSTAKGICFAHELPLIAINTLEAMAFRVKPYRHTWLCPMLDARRMEVYCALFDQEMNCLSPTEAKIIEENAFADALESQVIAFFGNGANKCQALIKHSNAHFLDDIHPSAQQVGLLAQKAFAENQFEDLAYFEPFYLKDFVGKKPKKLF